MHKIILTYKFSFEITYYVFLVIFLCTQRRFCDATLDHRQVPADQVEEVRALSQRFFNHMAGQHDFWERLEDYARRQKQCW